MKELFPGIFQINIRLKDFPHGSVNLYALRDQAHLTLIDTGWDLPASLESLQSQLAEAGLRFEDISRVLLTHGHRDHLGLINRLKESNRAAIYLHQNEMQIIKVRYNGQNDYWQKTDQFLVTHGIPPSELPSVGYPMPEISGLVEPDVWLKGGETIAVGDYSLRVINTPGHSPGHVSYYEPQQKILFSGDVLLPTIATNAGTHIQHMTNPLQQYLDSLNRLKELDIARVLPGHEYPFPDHRQRIGELLEHHRLRSESIQNLFRDNSSALNAYEVACRIAWSPKFKTITWDQLSTQDKRLAMMQSIAHLELLTANKMLIRLSQSDKMYYQSNISVGA